MSGELSDEQKELALYAARGGILDLLTERPALGVRISTDDLTEIYLAGVRAGCDATIAVMDSILKEEP